MPHLLNRISRTGGGIDWRLLALAALAVVAVVVAIVVFMPSASDPEPVPEPAPLPESAPELETVAPAQNEEQRGDSAREIIDRLRSASGGPDYAEALERAREFQVQDRAADAQLLYFFAARGGHAPAAFEMATFYDPNLYSSDTSIVDEPDPFQAYKWYREARDAGVEAAEDRLTDLRQWAEQSSADGNSEARRLLLQWES